MLSSGDVDESAAPAADEAGEARLASADWSAETSCAFCESFGVVG
jgi:hypothetical protein